MVKLKNFLPILCMLMLLPMVYLYSCTFEFGFLGDWRKERALEVTEFVLENTGDTITLPYTFMNLEPNEKIILSTSLRSFEEQRIYTKSVFSPYKIYANDELIFEYGADGTFPSYLQDPALQVGMIDMPNNSMVELRLEYSFPETRSDLKIEPPIVGTYPAIFSTLLYKNDDFSTLFFFSFGFGIVFLFIGLIICTFERQVVAVMWLGLISLLCGFWGFGEYDLSGIIIQNSSLLYLIAFTGVFYLPVAIQFYFKSIVSYSNSAPITICGWLSFILATVIMILQATSTISFYNSVPRFIVLTVILLIFSVCYTIYEWISNDNTMAKLALMPFAIIFVSAIIEGLLFLSDKTDVYSQIAQIGVFLFITSNSIICGILVNRALQLRAETHQMEQDYKLMEIQVSGQQRYHKLLNETRQEIRKQQHDLHHKLAVIHSLAREGDIDKLNYHLDLVNAEILETSQIYCDNIPVNSVVGHYVATAQQKGIQITVDLVVPEATARINASNLCVIFGNILENATEACERMHDEDKFIHISSHLHNGMLIIKQKNSFVGKISEIDGQFYSSKRNEIGIGLASVQSVAQKHGGNAVYTFENKVFITSIYIQI